LREIQLLRLALGTLARRQNVSMHELSADQSIEPREHRSSLRFLSVGYAELRRIRDLFRLVVAEKENPMDIESFIQIAKDLPPLQAMGIRPQFEREIKNLMITCGRKIDVIATAIAQNLQDETTSEDKD